MNNDEKVGGGGRGGGVGGLGAWGQNLGILSKHTFRMSVVYPSNVSNMIGNSVCTVTNICSLSPHNGILP